MASNVSSNTTMLQMLQTVGSFAGDFDEARNTPKMTFDAGELVRSVGILWSAMKEQRGFLELVEKEMASRKTEMNVRFKGMQNEMEGMLAGEGRRRQHENDKLRAEIQLVRDELLKLGASLQAEMKESQAVTQRGVDRALNSLKVALSDTQTRISDVSGSISNLNGDLQKLRGEQEASGLAAMKLKAELQSQLTTVFSFIGTSWNNAQAAVSNGTEREAFLKTPALASLSQRVRGAEEKGEHAKQEAAKANSAALLVENTCRKLAEDIASLRESIAATDKQIRGVLADEDTKLSRRIDDLATMGFSSKASSSPVVDATPALNALRTEVDQLSKTLKGLGDAVMHKADVSALSGKCDQTAVDALSAQLTRDVGEMQRDIADLKKAVGSLMVAAGQRPDIISCPSSEAELDDLRKELTQLRTMCDRLDHQKADKADLIAGLADLAKKTEKALLDFFNVQAAQAARQPSPTQHQDSTAGRFRCISCNRDAGPLQEQVNERMTKASFPPSTMLVQGSAGNQQQQQQQQQQRSIVNSRQAVPGLKEYGGSMTTSRKKLMNYYVWLQDKSDHPNPTKPRPTSASASRESPRTVSPSHPWPGAQSGQGTAGERQCGDHGTPEPEAVGLDGKYYVGVLSTGTVSSSRPRSAPHYGRRPNNEGAPSAPTALAPAA
jgi:hypothetical protein